jgi:hypothetical protein
MAAGTVHMCGDLMFLTRVEPRDIFFDILLQNMVDEKLSVHFYRFRNNMKSCLPSGRNPNSDHYFWRMRGLPDLCVTFRYCLTIRLAKNVSLTTYIGQCNLGLIQGNYIFPISIADMPQELRTLFAPLKSLLRQQCVGPHFALQCCTKISLDGRVNSTLGNSILPGQLSSAQWIGFADLHVKFL